MDDTQEQVAVEISLHKPVSTRACHYQAGLEQLLLGTCVAGSRKPDAYLFSPITLCNHQIRLDMSYRYQYGERLIEQDKLPLLGTCGKAVSVASSHSTITQPLPCIPSHYNRPLRLHKQWLTVHTPSRKLIILAATHMAIFLPIQLIHRIRLVSHCRTSLSKPKTCPAHMIARQLYLSTRVLMNTTTTSIWKNSL